MSALPEDVLRDILHRVARDYLKQEDGLRQCCKLAEALPCMSSLTLPWALLKQITHKDLPWEGETPDLLFSAYRPFVNWGTMPKLSKPDQVASSKSMCHTEFKRILLRQPSAALLDVSVHRKRPRKWSLYGLRFTERPVVHTWKGLVKEIKEECNEEVEVVVEMSEDGCGQRHLARPSRELFH